MKKIVKFIKANKEALKFSLLLILGAICLYMLMYIAALGDQILGHY